MKSPFFWVNSPVFFLSENPSSTVDPHIQRQDHGFGRLLGWWRRGHAWRLLWLGMFFHGMGAEPHDGGSCRLHLFVCLSIYKYIYLFIYLLIYLAVYLVRYLCMLSIPLFCKIYDVIWYDMIWHDMIWYDMIYIYIYTSYLCVCVCESTNIFQKVSIHDHPANLWIDFNHQMTLPLLSMMNSEAWCKDTTNQGNSMSCKGKTVGSTRFPENLVTNLPDNMAPEIDKKRHTPSSENKKKHNARTLEPQTSWFACCLWAGSNISDHWNVPLCHDPSPPVIFDALWAPKNAPWFGVNATFLQGEGIRGITVWYGTCLMDMKGTPIPWNPGSMGLMTTIITFGHG